MKGRRICRFERIILPVRPAWHMRISSMAPERDARGKWDNPMMYFALFVLIVLGVSAIAIWVFLAVAPGRIADQRGHRHADAVRVCGYWGALTLGLLMPLAFIWAYADGTSAPADRDAGNQA